MEEKILQIVRDILEDESVTLDMKREQCEAWDSAAHLIILSTIEDELNIEIPFDEAEQIEVIKDFLKYLKE